MKRYLLFLVFLFSLNLISAQVFDVETLKFSGPKDKRINLVILSEGYQTSELNQFITDAARVSNDMFMESPFSEYADYFNVFAIKVPSTESGADHPGTSTEPLESTISPIVPIQTVDTYFNATYDSFGFHRLLYYEIDDANANNTEAKIMMVLADNLPEYDAVVLLVNSDEYGGSGGNFAMSYSGFYAPDVAMHEMAHSLFSLIDEYFPIDETLAVEGINMTQETDPNLVKWKNWIGIDGVGIYQHEDDDGNPKPWYRPHQSCKMRRVDWDFCAVCKEGMIEKIHDLVSPIESFTPNNTTVNNPSLPLDIQLNLIKPIPNTLKSEWTLNGSNFANDVDDISLTSSDLVEGNNTLTAVVHDDSPLLKVDNHSTSSHVYTVTWAINYSSLSLEDIQSKTNNYSILLYPNPVADILNVKIESNTPADLKVNILSFDGKNIKEFRLSSGVHQRINIDQLSQGIYLINFYANNALIDSKKFVKQ
ncbi:T9SS type A sorting domain-containing protein [Hyunsoonleella sp. SJ7]|uniref:T9SS type A sorting domain-containing protein n=1 Tax=Hyunsoonleella aquatilis TaxID=2762758 RepID=A0A923HHJ4_9FLAO|nr:M64 family metallopeptidase [Hyunsoonleella aquatilis]MBC3759450.1 T9SS type A sorting domain-containing protein [Hyunsoonleella aquatilis]